MIDTRLSTDNEEPGVLSILTDDVAAIEHGSGVSAVAPGLRRLRMSSDTGIKAKTR